MYLYLDGEVAHALGHAAEEAVPHLGGQGVDPLGPGRLQAKAEEEEGAEGHNFHVSLVLRRCPGSVTVQLIVIRGLYLQR